MSTDPQPDVLDTGAAGGMAIRGGALRTAAYFAAMLLSLASVPFMTRHLGEVDYGYYVTATSILFIIGGFTEAGLTNLGTREYAVRDGADRATFLRDLVGLRLVLTLSGIVLAIAVTVVTGAKTEVATGVAIMGAGMVMTLTQQTYAVSLSAQLRLGWVSALELVKQGTLSLTIIALVVAGATLTPFFLASVLSGAVMLAVTLLVLRGEAGLVPTFHLGRWKPILKEVLPYALAAAVGLIYFRLAVILMSYLSTDEETGIYSAAYRVVETVGVIPWLLVSSAFPILARAAGRDDTARLRYSLGKLFDVAVLFGVLVSLATVVGAQFAIDVIAGAEFQESVGVLQLQALTLITAFLVATWSFALLSLRRYTGLLIANALAAATTAGLTVLLVRGLDLGADGAALATLGAESVLAAGYLVVLWRADRSLAPSPAIVARVLPGAGAMLAIGFLLDWHPVILVTLASLAYVVLAFALRAVPEELLDAVRRRGTAA